MPQPWITEELTTVDLGDKRLDDRIGVIPAAFANRPVGSIPAACGGRNDLEAAYRMSVLRPNNFTRPQQQVEGAGPLDGSQRRGAFLHLNEAFCMDGTPLGAVSIKIWSREEPDETLTAEAKRKIRRALPVEEKENIRCGRCIIVARRCRNIRRRCRK